MGRGKVELKRMEDKTSRQVSFSKSRNGLMKKAHELSVLCDVDVAAFVVSGRGRLYEFSSGQSVTKILTRYQDYKKADEIVGTIDEVCESSTIDEECESSTIDENLASECGNVGTANELMQMIQWHIEGHNVKKLDITELSRLEQQLDTILQQARNRKTQLMMGVVKALQEKEKQLNKEKRVMVEEKMAARLNENNADG